MNTITIKYRFNAGKISKLKEALNEHEKTNLFSYLIALETFSIVDILKNQNFLWNFEYQLIFCSILLFHENHNHKV